MHCWQSTAIYPITPTRGGMLKGEYVLFIKVNYSVEVQCNTLMYLWHLIVFMCSRNIVFALFSLRVFVLYFLADQSGLLVAVW